MIGSFDNGFREINPVVLLGVIVVNLGNQDRSRYSRIDCYVSSLCWSFDIRTPPQQGT
jgi:hypothetical protein